MFSPSIKTMIVISGIAPAVSGTLLLATANRGETAFDRYASIVVGVCCLLFAAWTFLALAARRRNSNRTPRK